MAEATFKCKDSDKIVLPDDATLKTWDAAKIFAWGESAWKRGDACAKQVDYDEHLKRCLRGNKLECTYVNQRSQAK